MYINISKTGCCNNRHRGAAALPISILILFVATLVLIAVSRTAMMEQRVSANDIRARQAHQAAQAGIDHALAYMQGNENGRGIDRRTGQDDDGPDGKADIITPAPFPPQQQAKYRVTYCDPAKNFDLGKNEILEGFCPPPPLTETMPTQCGEGFTDTEGFKFPLILSCGWSDDDRHAKKFIVVSVSAGPSLPKDNVEYPLISGGAVTLSGSASVANYFDDRIILTGGDYDTQSSAGHMYLRNPLEHNSPTRSELEDPEHNDCGVLTPEVISCSHPYYSLKADEQNILSIGNLQDLAENEKLFEKIFCMDFDSYAEKMPVEHDPPLAADDLDGIKGEVVVLTGNQTINGGDIGTPELPVILIIDGDLIMSGGPKIYGVVYVRGSITRATGQATIVGSLIAEEGVDFGAGTYTVIYDPETISNASNLGVPGFVSGSWRDWLSSD